MNTFYTNDKTTQIVLALLKAHGIRKVVVSPGTTNIALVGSMQIDSFFEIYSSVDERSAAYMACGLAYESGEPVILSCTEATASRNYLPGLTEAYYRKLPILAITGTHGTHECGHLKPQVIDRSQTPIDVVRMSVNLEKCKDKTDEWNVNVQTNTALLELTRDGGGPVHINLSYRGCSFNTTNLPETRIIKRYTINDELPTLSKGRIGIFIGSHKPWNSKQVELINEFCENHNAVVFCDKTSGYASKFRIDYAIIAAQESYRSPTSNLDLLLHIGEVSGDTYTQAYLKPKKVWRINPDGEIRDTFKRLSNVFAMTEENFFSYYKDKEIDKSDEYLIACKTEYNTIVSLIPEVEFSNIWIAQTIKDKIPSKSFVHFGIFNSLRSWNFAQTSTDIQTICNVGGFGIDGALSTLLGASLANPDKLHFIFLGDLAFFYDMNSLGNRHISKNMRIMIVNNGRGTEFRKYDHPCAIFKENADPFMAASGHYGNQSKTLVKNYAINLGFTYISASSKEEFTNIYTTFVNPQICDRPIIFEVFTEAKNESDAVDAFRHIQKDNLLDIKNKVKKIVKLTIKR